MDKKILLEIVTQFRETLIHGINNYIWIDSKERLINFPYNCCDVTSELLQKFLKEKYGLSFVIKEVRLRDNKGDLINHLYLENESFILDITGSQFNGIITNIEAFPEIFLEDNKSEYYFFNFCGVEKKHLTFLNPDEKDDEIYINFYNEILKEYESNNIL